MRKHWPLLLLLTWPLAWVAGCAPEYPECAYYPGDFVKFKLNGQVGQVLKTNRYKTGCSYHVRVAVPQAEVEHRWQVEEKPLAVIDYVREYELEPAG